MLARLKKNAQWLGGFAISALVFALVFLAYTRPDFIVTIANQVWLCF